MNPKNKINKILIISFVLILFGVLGIAKASFAATYYIAPSPTGNDSNNGLSQSTPFATFAKAFLIMQGGDTLYVMDGVYNQQIKDMPSGSVGNYTKIYALNDHKTEIDGQGIFPSVGWQGLLYISGRTYVEIRGLRIHSSSETNSVCAIENSNNIIIRVTGCWEAGAYKHDLPITISGGSTNNVLLEDVWAFGKGRYDVMVFETGSNIILRRVVTRFDSGSYAGEPNAGVSIYSSSNNIIENNITLDHKGQNVQGDHNGFYLPANYFPSNNNKFYGNIALNLPKTISGTQVGASGFRTDGAVGYNTANSFINNVAVNTDNGIVIGGAGPNANVLQNNAFADNYTNGIWNGGSAIGTIMKNNLLYKNGNFGGYNTGDTTASYNGAFQNINGAYSGLLCSPGCVITDPSLLYFPRLEATSLYKGIGEAGADIGANVVKRYQDGVLTQTDLWPWPYENWIKEDMCDTNFLNSIGRTGTSAPKWCATNKTLTQYIWEYLGNPIPTEIYGTAPDTVPPAAPTGLIIN